MAAEGESERALELATAYHYATSRCTPDDCPGVRECTYADHLTVEDFAGLLPFIQEPDPALLQAARNVVELWVDWQVPHSVPNQVHAQIMRWPQFYAALHALVDADGGDARRADAETRAKEIT